MLGIGCRFGYRNTTGQPTCPGWSNRLGALTCEGIWGFPHRAANQEPPLLLSEPPWRAVSGPLASRAGSLGLHQTPRDIMHPQGSS